MNVFKLILASLLTISLNVGCSDNAVMDTETSPVVGTSGADGGGSGGEGSDGDTTASGDGSLNSGLGECTTWYASGETCGEDSEGNKISDAEKTDAEKKEADKSLVSGVDSLLNTDSESSDFILGLGALGLIANTDGSPSLKSDELKSALESSMDAGASEKLSEITSKFEAEKTKNKETSSKIESVLADTDAELDATDVVGTLADAGVVSQASDGVSGVDVDKVAKTLQASDLSLSAEDAANKASEVESKFKAAQAKNEERISKVKPFLSDDSDGDNLDAEKFITDMTDADLVTTADADLSTFDAEKAKKLLSLDDPSLSEDDADAQVSALQAKFEAANAELLADADNGEIDDEAGADGNVAEETGEASTDGNEDGAASSLSNSLTAAAGPEGSEKTTEVAEENSDVKPEGLEKTTEVAEENSDVKPEGLEETTEVVEENSDVKPEGTETNKNAANKPTVSDDDKKAIWNLDAADDNGKDLDKIDEAILAAASDTSSETTDTQLAGTEGEDSEPTSTGEISGGLLDGPTTEVAEENSDAKPEGSEETTEVAEENTDASSGDQKVSDLEESAIALGFPLEAINAADGNIALLQAMVDSANVGQQERDSAIGQVEDTEQSEETTEVSETETEASNAEVAEQTDIDDGQGSGEEATTGEDDSPEIENKTDEAILAAAGDISSEANDTTEVEETKTEVSDVTGAAQTATNAEGSTEVADSGKPSEENTEVSETEASNTEVADATGEAQSNQDGTPTSDIVAEQTVDQEISEFNSPRNYNGFGPSVPHSAGDGHDHSESSEIDELTWEERLSLLNKESVLAELKNVLEEDDLASVENHFNNSVSSEVSDSYKLNFLKFEDDGAFEAHLLKSNKDTFKAGVPVALFRSSKTDDKANYVSLAGNAKLVTFKLSDTYAKHVVIINEGDLVKKVLVFRDAQFGNPGIADKLEFSSNPNESSVGQISDKIRPFIANNTINDNLARMIYLNEIKTNCTARISFEDNTLGVVVDEDTGSNLIKSDSSSVFVSTEIIKLSESQNVCSQSGNNKNTSFNGQQVVIYNALGDSTQNTDRIAIYRFTDDKANKKATAAIIDENNNILWSSVAE